MRTSSTKTSYSGLDGTGIGIAVLDSGVMKAHEDFLALSELQKQLDSLLRAAQAGDAAGIKAVLLNCVHGYGEQAD